MGFIIRIATEEDIPDIMCIMKARPSGNTRTEWFITDEEDAVRACLEECGYIIVAQSEQGEIAGFFIVRYPKEDENLGKYLGFSEEQLEKVILMDSVSVRLEFRGNGLQGKMLEEAEKRIDRDRYKYAMCTIHPDNVYSLYNMQKYGYKIQKTVKCYGDNIRHVLLKKI